MNLTVLGQWQHGRFLVAADREEVVFRDWLMPAGRRLPARRFRGLSGQALAQAWFEVGLVPGAVSAAVDTVVDRPRDQEDPLFWQYPCRTEGAAWDAHKNLVAARRLGDDLHVYLGFPWATWIDKTRKQAWGDSGVALANEQSRRTRVRLRGLRAALQSVGLGLRVHTVCQHIYWPDMLPQWETLGITDLWLSHCPPEGALLPRPGIELHPWRLYAVNVEDLERREGLEIGRDPARRHLLASFVGAHADHYLSDIRLRLLTLAQEPDMVIEVTGQWHFERIVYDEQVQGRPASSAPADDSVSRYNRLLSDSVFSLCPAGAGANTLRLWESLASGAIPVLLGPWPRLPEGGTIGTVDWDAALIRVADDELMELPHRLRRISLEQRRAMQRSGMALFSRIQHQRCF